MKSVGSERIPRSVSIGSRCNTTRAWRDMKCAGSKGPVPLSPEIAERLPDLGVELAVELVAAVGRVVDDPPVGDRLGVGAHFENCGRGARQGEPACPLPLCGLRY